MDGVLDFLELFSHLGNVLVEVSWQAFVAKLPRSIGYRERERNNKKTGNESLLSVNNQVMNCAR